MRNPAAGQRMTLGLDMKLQEDLAEGVIHLSPSGQVTDFNRAAVPWIKFAIVAKKQLQQQMAQIANGTLTPPVQLQLPDTADPALHDSTVHLCTAGPKGYALFIAAAHPVSVASAPMARDNDFFRLLGSQTRHELTHLRDALSTAGSENATAGGTLLEQSDRLSRLLVALDQLSRLHQVDAFQAGERLSLWRLVKQLVDETPRGQCELFITPTVESKIESESVIYGDAGWLQTCMRTLMTALTESAPAHSKFELRVRLSGAYIMVSSYCSNSSGRETQGRNDPTAASDEALCLDTDIGLQICHRVVELHGGQLTVAETDRTKHGVTGIESFAATFPLSAPSRVGSVQACAVCPMSMQMDKYAKDIAFLLKRHAVVAKTSPQEMQMLTKLLSASSLSNSSASAPASGTSAKP
jgi:hypothetical protein